MKLQRSPGPKRIASSISAAVATPSLTSHRASRHSASISRSATNPSISFDRISGCIPTLRYISAACCLVASDVCGAPAHLDERHEVDGVERMADDQSLGVHHVALHLGGEQARCRRTEHHVGPGDATGRSEQLLLQLQPLGRALLHEVGAIDGFLDGRDDSQRALRRPLRSSSAWHWRGGRWPAPRRPCAAPRDRGRTSPRRGRSAESGRPSRRRSRLRRAGRCGQWSSSHR